MLFVGVDLTSAFARQPRPIDVARLDDNLNCQFTQISWAAPALVTGRDGAALSQMLSAAVGDDPMAVWALDGPQGLATIGQPMRHCERLLGTPGRTPDHLPPAAPGGHPFGDYIRSSVDLFAALIARAQPSWRLCGLGGATLANATLYEIFPGSEWTVLAGARLPDKKSTAGRAARQALMARLGVQGLNAPPTHDQNDALVGAYLAWCTRHAPAVAVLVGLPPVHAGGELREGHILHATTNPVGAHAAAVDIVAAQPHEGAPEPARGQQEDDWTAGEDLVLKLTDYGVVHGTCPENAWLDAGVNYACETIAPDTTERFQLLHAPTFAGGRGWTVVPTIKPLLSKLGYSTPAHLGEQNAVTLRIRLV